MSLLRQLFGPSKDEVWQELCRQIGADWVDPNFWNSAKVQVRHGHWLLTLDTFVVSTGKSSTTYTRMRAPFVNYDGFRFTFYRAGLFTEMGKAILGTQDLAFPEDPLFDKAFVIQSNSPERVYRLLRHEPIRSRIAAQPQLYFTLKQAGGMWAQKFPPGVDELHFQVVGVIRDLDHLRWLFELFAETMNHLGHLDSGHRDDPRLLLADLAGPGGQVMQDQAVIWDGNRIRRSAARSLGELREERAVAALLAALAEPDAGLRCEAATALGRIGQPGAAVHLIPLLGDRELGEGAAGTVSAAAEGALKALGQEAWVKAFHRALGGEPTALAGLGPVERPRFTQALRSLLAGDDGALLMAAGRALVELGAVEAAPDLQKAARRLKRAQPETFAALDDCAEALRRHQALPRPADTPTPAPETLPLPAAPAAGDAATLPRPSGALD